MTGVSECSQQRGNLKDDGYRCLGVRGIGFLKRRPYPDILHSVFVS
ncbi:MULTISPECIES: hypothetical protein [Photorhabdus]|uniref:Transposase n=2 Tax=Photorhabdus TaxID=29487 RepID=A0ABX0B2U4_9GAMM|nr:MULTISPECIES: hypothetical protein [Photorhabdus]MCC8375851.1 hypothetical protein [Photorhabdus bodei]MCT8351068.1 hypothetical protein [Photorhabdus kayaii]MDB6367145.1 hypothetical protein [Photorhabdus bodei]MDB6370624.1 hypothetical protein [Photorhabdus bodei]NDL13185.1 hypothetical protein [Photorhabdus kayaii]